MLLSRVAYGEADLVVHLFTERRGKVSALARGALRSSKRFGGALEPLHTLHLEFEERQHAELATLKSASLQRPRLRLVESLTFMETAGKALSWVRKASPARTAEPALFAALVALLDHLDSETPPSDAEREGALLALGLRLLDELGFGLELDRCVSCGRPCPENQSSWIAPERGGLVCRRCGGGPLLITGAERTWMKAAVLGGAHGPLEGDREVFFRVVERAITAHVAV